jgi:hypothetical protein
MKVIVLLTLVLSLSGCIGEAVRSVTTGAADIGTGAVDVVTAPIP